MAPDQPLPPAWLEWRTGALNGHRFLVGHVPFFLGRGPKSGIHLSQDDSRGVSKTHLEIRREQEDFEVVDHGSTNGTFLNGIKVTRSKLAHGDRIALGPAGPAFNFLTHLEEQSAQTLISSRVDLNLALSEMEERELEPSSEQEALLHRAVKQVRRARQNQVDGNNSGQTFFILRELLQEGIYRKTRKFNYILVCLVLLVGVLAIGLILQSSRLVSKKGNIDLKIQELEVQINRISDPEQMQKHLTTLSSLQAQARQIEKNLLYEIGSRDEETDFLRAELHRILQDLGAETYSVPPDFLAAIKNHVGLFSTNESSSLSSMFFDKEYLGQMKEVFKKNHLPEDLVYISYVESRFQGKRRSSMGAVGIWQLRYTTAKAFGLKVSKQEDERQDVIKSTQAAARYMKKLILDFGSGSSVLLAMAAYNYGPTKLRDKIRQIPDPIQQRNFWHLYRSRSLPAETREYVPKVLAVMIIGRNLSRFGLSKTPEFQDINLDNEAQN